jgi:hypothetical protein
MVNAFFIARSKAKGEPMLFWRALKERKDCGGANVQKRH